jgi:hypothetical protein
MFLRDGDLSDLSIFLGGMAVVGLMLIAIGLQA